MKTMFPMRFLSVQVARFNPPETGRGQHRPGFGEGHNASRDEEEPLPF